MNSLTWDNRQFLAEVNQDLGIPLSFKVALQEFHAEAMQAIQSDSQLQKRTLLEFNQLPLADLKAAFVNLGPADVNKVHLVTDVIKPGESNPTPKVPVKLIQAMMSFLNKSLVQGIEKLPIMKKNPALIARLRDRFKTSEGQEMLDRFDKIMAGLGKVSSLGVIAISALGILAGLPIPSTLLLGGVALLIRAVTDLLQGKKWSEITAGILKGGAVMGLGAAISYMDSRWFGIRDWIVGHAQELAISPEQTQAVASANSLSQVPSQEDIGATMGAPTVPASGGQLPSTGQVPAQADIGATMGAPTEPGQANPDVYMGGAPTTPPTPVQADIVANANAAPLAGANAVGTTTITVPPGGTLSQIAQANRVSVADLMQANDRITDPNKIIAGAKIVIPTETGSPVYDRGVGLPRRRG